MKGYWRRFLHRLWTDAAPWARDNVIWGAVVLVIPPLAVKTAHPNSKIDWPLIRETLYLYGVSFGLYLLFQCGRTAERLDSDRRKETNDKQSEITSYQERLQSAEKQLHDSRPQLSMLVMADDVRKWNQGQQPFAIHNSGQRPARYIDILPIESEIGNYTLHLNVVNRELLMPNVRGEIAFEVFERTKSPKYIVDAMKSEIQMLQLFFKDGGSLHTATYPIQITYQDTEASLRFDRMILHCERPSLKLSLQPAPPMPEPQPILLK